MWHWHNILNNFGASALSRAGSGPRTRKRLTLPTLAEEPLKEKAAQQDLTKSKALVGVPTSISAAEENAQAVTCLNPSLAGGAALHEDEKVKGQSSNPISYMDHLYSSVRHAWLPAGISIA